jgi:predicted RNA-binding protein with PIN domain
VRWLVDGMNVIGTRPDGWWKDRQGAMVRLADQLERWAEVSVDQVTVVFEEGPQPPISSRTIEIVSAPRPMPNAADDEIVRLLESDPDPGEVRVVTSDKDLVERVRELGAEVEPASSFRGRIEQAERKGEGN